MPRFAIYAACAAAAGAFMPVMPILNVRLGRALGEPDRAPVVLFLVGLLAVSTVSLLLSGGPPDPRLLMRANTMDFAGGMIMATYVITVTLLAPRFNIGKVILFAVTAQIMTSAVIDHFGRSVSLSGLSNACGCSA